jgi:hypothetical protein
MTRDPLLLRPPYIPIDIKKLPVNFHRDDGLWSMCKKIEPVYSMWLQSVAQIMRQSLLTEEQCKGLSKLGYRHYFVNHNQKEFCRVENEIKITTNRIEGFWG